MPTPKAEMDLILDRASAQLETAIEDEFEKALAQQGIDLVELNAEPLMALGKRAFGHALTLIAAGDVEGARRAAFEIEDFEDRMVARRKALKISHDEGELQEDLFEFLGGAALSALKAALPFILAAII